MKLRDNKLLLSEPAKVESIDDAFLRKLAEQIEAGYASPEDNVEKLSETLGLSRGHLHRKIKELTGTAPVEFLRTYRLNKATQLLRQNAYTVSEVAYRTGFSSPAYFSKCFKAVYGVTPTAYQYHLYDLYHKCHISSSLGHKCFSIRKNPINFGGESNIIIL